jgi:hypothetical protein
MAKMMKVGLVGWRGMVGSVLVGRMQEERDFDHVHTTLFSTSQAGQAAIALPNTEPVVADAGDVAALSAMDVLISCQGGDYTTAVHPKLRAAGWNGYWIDAASTLRMQDHAVIILDPVNRGVIDAALAAGGLRPRGRRPPGADDLGGVRCARQRTRDPRDPAAGPRRRSLRRLGRRRAAAGGRVRAARGRGGGEPRRGGSGHGRRRRAPGRRRPRGGGVAHDHSG